MPQDAVTGDRGEGGVTQAPGHHIPTARPACWTTDASPRPWLWTDRHQPKHRAMRAPITACHFATMAEHDRRKVQGDSCDGCALLEVR